MTDRTDHRAVSVDLLNHISKTPMEPERALVYLVGANVHATLALAEQQRIANLIAAQSLPSSLAGPAAATLCRDDGAGRMLGWRPEIAAALDIEGGDDRG